MKNFFKEFFFILLGALVMAIGFSYFLIPNEIAAGGAGGVATILHSKFGLPVSLVVLSINAVLFAISWKTMPKSVFVKSAVGTLALTLFLEITADATPFTDDILMAAAFGGILMGTGVGVVIKYGASTGGSDFLAIILYKVLNKRISVANLILIIDGLIIITAGFAFADYTLMLYMVASVYVSSKVADAIVEGGNAAKSAYIISEKSKEISDEIMNVMRRGTTGIYGKGMYTNRDSTLILCVVIRNEIPKLRTIVKKIDPKAFIILSDVREVHGEGF
ncbi:MAG: YitT family protein [Clostridia bacterium]|nr:YitT family protein [Clostridia bacterium]